MTRKQRAAAAAALVGLVLLVRWRCRSGWPDHDGQLRQTANLMVYALQRGAEGVVDVSATGHYAVPNSGELGSFTVPELDGASLALLDGAGQATPLKVKWVARDSHWRGKVTLPEVGDGDYRVRAEIETELGKSVVEAPLPLYAPARIHVITDRPLYEAGNLVRFRAVVLRARDLAPIDGRPGRWVVRDPAGEILLEEDAPAGEFGVVAGSFPLERGAAEGTWQVEWRSGATHQLREFAVRPFTLPRFRVEAAAERPFYSAGDAPVVRGAVTYSSGAPVAAAKLELSWQADGDWPLPLAWNEELLPRQAEAAADGQFTLRLPTIPADLTGRTTLRARIVAIDPAGDRLESSAAILLSADRIQVAAVSELGEGLMQGFNNRLYLRATTPDGRVLQGAKLNVKRAWQPGDPGIEAQVDEDGVAALQLDPGPPVNVVIPAPPWRPRPRPPQVLRGAVRELLGGAGATVEDQLVMDRWLGAVAGCAKWFDAEHPEAQVALRVAASGALTTVSAADRPLDRCAAAALRGQRLAAGAERIYTVPFTFRDPDLPTLTFDVEGALGEPDELERSVRELVAGARDCLPMTEEGALPRALSWRVAAGGKEVQLGSWIADPRGGTVAAALPCVSAQVGRARIMLDEPVPTEQFGLIRFAVALPEQQRQQRPPATTMLGYEFTVSAADDSAAANGAPRTTTLRLRPGEIPPLRLRVTPVLPKAGERVTAELFRGPSYVGELPKTLSLTCLAHRDEQKLDPERRAVFTLPADTDGWCQVVEGSARALFYIKPAGELAVTVTPERPRYAPGQQAKLAIRTWLGGKGAKAAVGLVGVDQSLGQLVPLDGPEELDQLRPRVETSAPAFGEFDGQALTLGRIAGANAAAATVLRVSAIPPAPELDAVVSANASAPFDAIEVLTDRFYVVLAELYVQARAWERSAPATEKMHPATMAKLWSAAVAACERRGEAVKDAFGRTLRLRMLPEDLLALTDPHAVITGTRLPEDVENWTAWVVKRRP